MKILFFCGSAEPGKDGVGDYTRRLCGELIRLNISAQIVSLCDKQSVCFRLETQFVDDNSVTVNRIPLSTSNKQRYIFLQNIVNTFDPDLISLQYVPYSFNPKGLPFWLPSLLQKLKGQQKWHIMFHELWLGIDAESSLKHKFIGKLQQLIAKKIIHNIEPNYVNTQNVLYQNFLKSHNINASLLPICSNIALTALKKENISFTQFVLFGTIHQGAPFGDFVDDLINNVSNFNKPIKFVFIGINGPELNNFTNILKNNNISYLVLGAQPEKVISQILLDSDYGISTTPYFQTEKSGVYAAYKEHNINTICVSRRWTPTKGQYIVPQIIKYEKNNLNITKLDIDVFDLNTMAKKFIKLISTS